jgi:hypothetical protein
MGVLDDAIRQHLELKRQHGVPEEELRRQEEEALGPARRDVARAESADGGGELAAEPETAEPVAAEGEEPEAAVQDEETALQEPLDEAPAEEPEAAPPPFDGSADLSAPAEPVLDPDTHEEPPGDTPPSGVESLDEDESLDEPDEGDADVLEDTPDFLQETPEHDRLWFEQKPPRDFDFD